MEHYKNFELKNYTSFKIGGTAENVYFPQTFDEFVSLLSELENPLVLGGMSNLLVSSQGIAGSVILTKKLSDFTFEGNTVKALAGAMGPLISKAAAEKSLTGMEFMCGFPGTIGGIVFMNASAHAQRTSDIFKSAKLFDKEKKQVVEFDKEDMKFDYRTSIMQTGRYILLEAVFELEQGEQKNIYEKIEEIKQFRKEKQPNLSEPNCGSVFKNPDNLSAGKLLDDAGAKELLEGNAKVSEKHANFIINKGNATSTDVSLLMKKMYNKVKEISGIRLSPEVCFVGKMNEVEKEIWKEFSTKKSI